MTTVTEGVCATCRRVLDVQSDPLSQDCGGDCWGCVGEAEANHGYPPAISKCNAEIDDGFRQGPKFEIRKGAGHA